MPDRAILQPNGRYAIFSTVVDHFTAYDGTREDVLNAFREQFRAEADRNAEAKMNRADERNAANAGEDFWAAIQTISHVHGDAESERIKTLLSSDSGGENG